MPRIMRPGGVNLTDDVVRIKDVAPAPPVRKKPQPAPGEDSPELGLPSEGAGAPAEIEPGDPAEMLHDPAADTVGGEIIQSAMAEAGRILENAVKEAQNTRDGILAEIEGEADRIRQEAEEQGRRQGFSSVVGEMQELAGRLEQAVGAFEGERAGFEAEYEEQLRWLAIEIASKVLAKKVSEDDAEMTEMVQKAVQSVRSEPWVRVDVSQEMVHLIDRLTGLYDEQANIEVSAIPAPPGTVHIETPSGVVDASLRTQLANLRDYFNANLTGT